MAPAVGAHSLEVEAEEDAKADDLAARLAAIKS